MTEQPDPMTPADCDLRGMPYMPLSIVQLFDSDLYALSTGDEFKAALTLWGKAFLQVPAGSLPTDDRILAHLSGAGARWPKVRDMALRGWTECKDGRLYHRIVAQKAVEAWQHRLGRRNRTEAARKMRHAPKTADTLQVTEPHMASATSSVTEPVTGPVTDNVTGSKGTEGNRREEEKEREEPASLSQSREREPPRPLDLDANGRQVRHLNPSPSDPKEAWLHLADRGPDGGPLVEDGQEFRVGERIIKAPPKDIGEPICGGFYLRVAAEQVCRAAFINETTWRGDWRPLTAWLRDGLSLSETIVPAISLVAARPGYKPPASLKYFDAAVREKVAA